MRPAGLKSRANFDQRMSVVIPNQAHVKIFSRHTSLGCTEFCVNERSHFLKWKNAYQNNLQKYFEILSKWLRSKNSKNSKKGFKVNYEDFAEFAYTSSSGYISPHT